MLYFKNMDIDSLISYTQIILSILLVLMILFQRTEGGLGGVFGGGDISEGSHFQRRGYERMFFFGTFVVAFLFLASILLPILFVK